MSRIGKQPVLIPDKVKVGITNMTVLVEGPKGKVSKTFAPVVKMKYVDGAPAITGVDRTSTPGRRLYASYTEIPRVLNGLGIAIVSTSKGLMKDQDARRSKLGGELVCTVW